MTEYTPREGDRVRRTFQNGTYIEGVISFISSDGLGWDSSYNVLSPNDEISRGQVELIHRPVTVDDDKVGTVYQYPGDAARVVVRVDTGSALPWMGFLGGDSHWHSSETVQKVVQREGWEKHDIRTR